MGMEAVLVQATPAQLREFQEDPRLAYQYVTGDPGGEDKLARIEAMTRASFDRMEIPPQVRQAVENHFRSLAAKAAKRGEMPLKPQQTQQEKRQFSLNKDWHVLHYALNGTAEGGDPPLAFAIFCDKEFPEMDGVDYGPARYLTPEQVQRVSASLQAIEPSTLLSRLNYEDAKKKRIYLDHTLKDPGNWSYLPELFVEFQKFYSDAAERGNGMVMKIL